MRVYFVHYTYVYIYAIVCIDVAARGLDVKEVQLVVNFDMPNNIEVYILLVTLRVHSCLHIYSHIYKHIHVYRTMCIVSVVQEEQERQARPSLSSRTR